MRRKEPHVGKLSHFSEFYFCVGNEIKVHFFLNFQIPYLLNKITVGIKILPPCLKNTLSYNYGKIQENLLTFYTQNACSKCTCFGKIWYREKGKKKHSCVRVCKPVGVPVIVGLILCSVIS